MIFTNVHSLPDPVVRALSYDDYDRVGDISVTGLLRPAQVAYLEEQHAADLTEDVSDRIWQLFGSVAHGVLYRATDQSAVIAEKRLTMEVEGWTIAGKADIYDTNTKVITDYKTTSVWSVIFEPDGKAEHVAQLNLYRLLLESNGYPVEGLQVINILRDWSKRDSVKRNDYPRIPIHVTPIPLWSREQAEKYLVERVRAHQQGRKGHYQDCTDEERWFNAKTGEYTRCAGYCSVSRWCPTLMRE